MIDTSHMDAEGTPPRHAMPPSVFKQLGTDGLAMLVALGENPGMLFCDWLDSVPVTTREFERIHRRLVVNIAVVNLRLDGQERWYLSYIGEMWIGTNGISY